ncbi:MAG TPA: phosphate acyltransferase PlsX [Bacillota bacterium]|nr:phosphate acyltransferase PlsX [Bacillota bacterium]
MKIAVDAMGGDFAPKEIVKGAIAACQEIGAEVILVGNEANLKSELAHQPFSEFKLSDLKLEIYPATEVIAMDEHPVSAVKRKQDSSLVVANRLVKEGKAAAVISAGNTGAAMSASLLTLGRIERIKRPAIASLMPTRKGLSIILDAGANVDCEPENLLQFALMGSVYAEQLLGMNNPKVGLLSIGEEETKGNKLTIEAHQLLKNSRLNFIGNIEGRDIHSGMCEVIVCDGFTGNTILKLTEGMASFFFNQIREAMNTNSFSRLGGFLLKKSLRKMKETLDYTEYGGAPLLGLSGISLISHGSSNSKAIKNAIKAAVKALNQDIIAKIAASVQSPEVNHAGLS